MQHVITCNIPVRLLACFSKALVSKTPTATSHSDCSTDCKFLYDAVLQTTPSLEEKRCSIDIASIREAVIEISKLHPFLPGRLQWCPTHEQRADGLTKLCRKLRAATTQWMMMPTVRLASSWSHRASAERRGVT